MKRNSSPLLIHESPLQVLPSLAVKIGLHEAIILQQVHYWISQPRAYRRDEKFWVYNTYKEWTQQFPFLSAITIKRAILKLEKDGLLIAVQFDIQQGDARKYYSINYDQLNNLLDIRPLDQNDPTDEIKMIPPPDQSDPTPGSKRSHLIRTETNTEINAETNTDIRRVDSSKKAVAKESVNDIFEYWKNTLRHPTAKLTEDRRQKIVARLKDGYSVEQIKQAIDGCSLSAFHNGQNDRNKLFNDIELICRNGSKLEGFISMAETSMPARPTPKFEPPPNWDTFSKWEQKKYKDNWYKTAFSVSTV